MTVTVPINVDLSIEMQKHVTLTYLNKQLKDSIRDDLDHFKVECDDWLPTDSILSGELKICDWHPHSGNYNYRETDKIRPKSIDLYRVVKILK